MLFEQTRQLAIFDLNAQEIFRTIDLSEPGGWVAARMTRVIVWLPRTQSLQSYSLLNGQRERGSFYNPGVEVTSFVVGIEDAGGRKILHDFVLAVED